jgi:hypothetical protein
VRDDLQDLVDQVARLLGAPATLEDAGFTLLAYCAHGDGDTGMDAVRTRSILTRSSPPATRRWFEEFGIATACAPLRTPADPAAGIRTRLCLPVRHAGRTHGYLWLLDEGRTDAGDPAAEPLAAAVELAAEAGRLLAERSAADAALDRALHAALTGSPAAREHAGRVLAGVLPGAQVLVAVVPGPGGLPGGWRPPGAGAVSAVVDEDGGSAAAVAVPLLRAGDLRPAAALASAALAGPAAGGTAGVSAARRGPHELAAQWAEARAAARVARAVQRFRPVAQWAELGAWRTAAQLPGPDPALARLLDEPVLAATAETWLDAAGSAGRAAAELGVHRQTLYYRLGRVAELTGLDLADGGDRLLLHAGLRAARLSPARAGTATRRGAAPEQVS